MITNGFIYRFVFPNGKSYIGQTKHKISTRWAQHKNASETPSNKSYSFPLYKAIRCYGWDNIQKEILIECPTEELNDQEIKFINEFGSLSPNGYNMNTGGNSFTMSEESKRKIGAGVKTHQASLSPQSLAKWKNSVRQKHIGKHNLSDNSKVQISQSLRKFYKENPQTNETKDKRSSSRRKRGDGLPRFVNVRNFASGPIYVIAKHPLVKYKQFNELEKCLQHLNMLNVKLEIAAIQSKLIKLIANQQKILQTIDEILRMINDLQNRVQFRD